ncbi:MAG: hypothetical protein HWE30_11540 [Methylocystaceae bacterium]|nr:hypothetical protein [Methylocystaceae bacterium]
MVSKLILICFSFLFFSISGTLKAGTRSSNVSQHWQEIARELHCEKPPCNLRKIRMLYESDRSFLKQARGQFYYSVILQHTAGSDREFKMAQDMEKHALTRMLYSCDLPYSAMASKANLIATLYDTNLFFPRSAARAKHWRNVAQSFKETSMYRCPNIKALKCWPSFFLKELNARF